MSLALVTISSFCILALLSSNTVRPVKFLIVIILVLQGLNFVVQNCGEWRLGVGVGVGKWVHRILYL